MTQSCHVLLKPCQGIVIIRGQDKALEVIHSPKSLSLMNMWSQICPCKRIHPLWITHNCLIINRRVFLINIWHIGKYALDYPHVEEQLRSTLQQEDLIIDHPVLQEHLMPCDRSTSLLSSLSCRSIGCLATGAPHCWATSLSLSYRSSGHSSKASGAIFLSVILNEICRILSNPSQWEVD